MDDILRDFVIETSENIDLVDAELVRFEQEPNNRSILAQIFRLVHTVKGTCGFLGLARLETLAHAAETVIGKLRDGVPVTRETVTLILDTVDRIKVIVASIEANAAEPPGDDADLIRQLDAMTATVVGDASSTTGTLVYQVLERPLKPDEVTLDDLERAFRSAPGPDGPPAPVVSEPASTVSGVEFKRNSIRVSVETLERMMTMVSELVLTRNQLLEVSRRANLPEYAVPLQRLSQVTGELQDGVMKTRMQPVGHAWARLPRLVRDLAAELGKDIDLQAEGAGTEIDRQLLDLMSDPITHIIRNAADHGIETPDERIAAGKPRRGTIRLSAVQEGGYIRLEIADDGRGLDMGRIRRRAMELGLVPEAELDRMSESQLARLVFQPGFSTARTVTNISGRGVGMDVVQTNIDRAGGSVEARSTPGKGTTILIRIPLTLAIAAALIVNAGGQHFALPQLAVVEIVRPRAGSDAQIEYLNDVPVLRLRDQLLPVTSLAGLLWPEQSEAARRLDGMLIVVCSHENAQFGLAVESVLKTEEIVVKPVAAKLRNVPTYSGTTILGDGSVIMILDPNAIGARVGALSEMDVRHTSLGNRRVGDLSEAKTSLLLFRAGGVQMAVPLGLVTRLEEIDATTIEATGDQRVVQYRGRLMPLVPAHGGMQAATGGSQPVLVFSRGGRAAGLMVDEILDIVEERLEIERMNASDSRLGSAVVRGRATEIVDVAALLPFVADSRMDAVARREKPTVVLVDDNEFFRALLAPVLKAAGFRVHVAEAGEDAFRLVESTGCAALVTDLDMPRVSGFDLATRLRAETAFAGLRIVGLSERGGAATVARGRALGFDDIVGKFDRQGLVASLLDLLSIEAEAA